MRYELNFDEDKVNDVLVVGGASYDLKGCCELLNEKETRIDLLEKGILDCLFEDKSIGMFALDMGLVYNG